MLRKMPPYFEFDDKSFSSIPTWIIRSEFSLECSIEMALGMIVSYVGEPITTDQFTMEKSRPSYTSVLVEVDVTKPLARMVSFQLPNGVVRNQPIFFEHEPHICSIFHRIWHES